MDAKLLVGVLSLAVASCANTVASGPGDAELARAQLLALADTPQNATFEGLETTPSRNRAVCGRMTDPGAPNTPTRFFLEPVGKRVRLDPATTLPATGDDAAIANCNSERRKRVSYESREAVCRPAEVLRREARLRESFDRRFERLCG